jgi:hypothetical protein
MSEQNGVAPLESSRLHWFDPRWRQLRSIGNSTAAKLTILIPLVGYLVLLNDKMISYLELSERIFGQAAAVGTLNKLLAVYIGLVCVAIASATFALCCPLEIKKYASSEEYIAAEEAFMSAYSEGLLEARLKVGDTIARTELKQYQDWNDSRPTPDGIDEVRRRGQRFFRIEMNLFYEMQDRTFLFGRWLVAVFYLIGFTALLFPSGSVFIQVIAVLIKNWRLIG